MALLFVFYSSVSLLFHSPAFSPGNVDVYLFLKGYKNVYSYILVSFDGENIEDAPPLWVAAAAGHLELVRYLLKKGAGVNAVTRTNSTPLRAACFDGHTEVVRCLLEAGAGKKMCGSFEFKIWLFFKVRPFIKSKKSKLS